MGRKKQSATVHLLHGDPSKLGEKNLLAQVQSLKAEAPPCPRWLGETSRAEWRRITPLLVAAGLLTLQDHATLEVYCEAYGEWVETAAAIEAIKKARNVAAPGSDASLRNPLVDVTPSGYKQVSVMAQVRDRACDRMLRAAAKFGLNPSERIAATTGQQLGLPGMPTDPMEAFLQAGSAARSAAAH